MNTIIGNSTKSLLRLLIAQGCLTTEKAVSNFLASICLLTNNLRSGCLKLTWVLHVRQGQDGSKKCLFLWAKGCFTLCCPSHYPSNIEPIHNTTGKWFTKTYKNHKIFIWDDHHSLTKSEQSIWREDWWRKSGRKCKQRGFSPTLWKGTISIGSRQQSRCLEILNLGILNKFRRNMKSWLQLSRLFSYFSGYSCARLLRIFWIIACRKNTMKCTMINDNFQRTEPSRTYLL